MRAGAETAPGFCFECRDGKIPKGRRGAHAFTRLGPSPCDGEGRGAPDAAELQCPSPVGGFGRRPGEGCQARAVGRVRRGTDTRAADTHRLRQGYRSAPCREDPPMPLWPPAPRTDPACRAAASSFPTISTIPILDPSRWDDSYLPLGPRAISAGRATASRRRADAPRPDRSRPGVRKHDATSASPRCRPGTARGPSEGRNGQHDSARASVCARPGGTAALPANPPPDRDACPRVCSTRCARSLYLIGFEDRLDDSGEITVMEIFGRESGEGGTVVRRGVKRSTIRGSPRRSGTIRFRSGGRLARLRGRLDGDGNRLRDRRPTGRPRRRVPRLSDALMLTLYRLAPAPDVERATATALRRRLRPGLCALRGRADDPPHLPSCHQPDSALNGRSLLIGAPRRDAGSATWRGIAQLVERRSPKPQVAGSSPAAPCHSRHLRRWPEGYR